MAHLRRLARPLWLAVGLLLGLVIGGLWPDVPLHAVATDRLDNFAIATGFVDDDVEAIYFLDVLTATLKAAVVSNQTQFFQARYEANLYADLTKSVHYINQRRGGGAGLPPMQLPQTPNYMMVTGMSDLRRGQSARTRPSLGLVYVAETNTGIVLAYRIPWDQGAHAANRPTGGKLILQAYDTFTTALVRSP